MAVRKVIFPWILTVVVVVAVLGSRLRGQSESPSQSQSSLWSSFVVLPRPHPYPRARPPAPQLGMTGTGNHPSGDSGVQGLKCSLRGTASLFLMAFTSSGRVLSKCTTNSRRTLQHWTNCSKSHVLKSAARGSFSLSTDRDHVF